ncbi:hypothetical protein ABH999_003143 [Bradyrhizobium yuanmingense]|uniref:hypothetical protein n=1 Tax=Bradyrhizobium yuanmingense TaxID=108015 RepID=UPI0005600F86|nr:hypothetical protein [Bradyrhizobium yuanmingense]
MASEKQYLFFKSLYDEENERTKLLGEHAKNNLGLVTVYSAFIIFVMDKQVVSMTTIGKWLFIGAILLMLASILLSLLATQVAEFEVSTLPSKIFENFGDSAPTDEDFFDDRIADYSVACENNSVVNDRKAKTLTVARYLLLAGVAAHAAYFIERLR